MLAMFDQTAKMKFFLDVDTTEKWENFFYPSISTVFVILVRTTILDLVGSVSSTRIFLDPAGTSVIFLRP